VILPTAAVEQHGEHLPLGTDCMIVRAIIDRLDDAMDHKLLVLPIQQVACSEFSRLADPLARDVSP